MKFRLLLLIACGAPFLWIGTGRIAAQEASAAKCTALVDQDGVRSAVLNAPAPNPEHCEVTGALNEREGANGQKYAIKFHMRLPSKWNGDFFFEGGGGSNGNVGMAFGNLQGQQRTNALTLGYAVVSQDSGHDNAANNDPQRDGTQTFGFDPQARLDFGYNSYDQVTRAAKSILRRYYGKAQNRSYYVGCSEGGREGMMMSQRFPAYFDGILACSPGFTLPKAALFGETWDTQSFAELAKAGGFSDPAGLPLLNKTFTDEDLDLVSQAILSACDALDKLEDGIIDNFRACTTQAVSPKLAGITCKAAKDAMCISAPQVAALKKVFDGAKNSKGEMLYAPWAWDRGVGGKQGAAYNQGWRSWKIGAYSAANNSAINATLGANSVAALFTTPPTAAASPLQFLLSLNLDRDAAKLYAESGTFTKSAWDYMMASSTDLSAYKNRGGKLVIVQGVSDPIFSIQDTIRWWEEVNAASNGKAADFVRLFAVPGMNHCAGGPATDQFNAFEALTQWVEQKTAPERIAAKAGNNSPWPGRERPLCAYPQQSRYRGSGSIEQAASFVCQ